MNMVENLLNSDVLSEIGVNELSHPQELIMGGCSNGRHKIGLSWLRIIEGKKYCQTTIYRPFEDKQVILVPLMN